MTHLMDVNALVALGFLQHEFHTRLTAWIQADQSLVLGTCSITELGFLRVLTQAPAYGFTVPQARTLLFRLKRAESSRFIFVTDDHDPCHLPSWVKSAKQITDGHLVRLAQSKGAVLATLDRKIPGAFVIP